MKRWGIAKKRFSPAVVARLLAASKQAVDLKSTPSNKSAPSMSAFSDTALVAILRDRCETIRREVFGDEFKHGEWWRVNYYPNGGRYTEHTDRRTKDPSGEVSLIVGLNDDYLGGELAMAGQIVKVGPGDLVFFEATMPHSVTMVVGKRYSLVSYLSRGGLPTIARSWL